MRRPERSRNHRRRGVPRRLAGAAVDLVLLGTAAWLLFGPRAQVRRELEAWTAERRTRALVRDRWPELAAARGVLGGGGPGDPVLVEFTDYRCPFCGHAQAAVDALLEGADPVRVVIRHLPIEALHPDAPFLARVSVCAETDPAFPAVHRALFDAPPAGELAPLLARAGAADPEALLRCAASEPAHRRVDADLRLAADLGLTGTPSFLGRDRIAAGALSVGDLRRMLGLAEP